MRRLALSGLLALTIAGPAIGEETVVHAPGPLGPLGGVFLSAGSKSAPVVVIVPGSGPTDRDGNSPLGIKASMYRLLAEGLASRGIASIRIDKRGLFGSRTAIADPEAVTIADYATDVRAWMDVARQRTDRDCVWIVGHSEGGLVGLAAAQTSSGLCGLVLLSAPGRRLGQVLREQFRANPANAPLLDQALAAIDSLEGGKRIEVNGLPAPLQLFFRPSLQSFLIDAFARDPAGLIAGVQRPVLLVQGKRDSQVSGEDAALLSKANPSATLVYLADANHVFKDVPENDREANLRAYGSPDLPLAAGLVDAIASFIDRSSEPR